MKSFILLSLQLFPFFLGAQVELDSFVDSRDGKVYATVQIEHTIWFRDNLKFETTSSHFPKDTKKESSYQHGNFYSYKELDNVCPSGWRIPNEKDWEQYFKFRIESQSGSISDVQIDSLNEEYLSLVYRDTTNKVQLFGASNPLGLDEFGWVEGKKIRNWGTTTLWIRNSKVDDKRFHLHIGDGNYVFHRHKHHIDDVKRKTRKFMVKCVKSLDSKN